MRPDQPKFDQFTAPLAALEPEFTGWGEREGFGFVRHVHRTPSLMLRKSGNPLLLIEVYLELVWHQVEFSDDVPYKFTACTYLREQNPPYRVWRFGRALAAGKPLIWIKQNLPGLLAMASGFLETCSTSIIVANGEEMPEWAWGKK